MKYLQFIHSWLYLCIYLHGIKGSSYHSFKQINNLKISKISNPKNTSLRCGPCFVLGSTLNLGKRSSYLYVYNTEIQGVHVKLISTCFFHVLSHIFFFLNDISQHYIFSYFAYFTKHCL